MTDRDLKRAMDPDLGLPPKEELFVKDVFLPDAFRVFSHHLQSLFPVRTGGGAA